MAISGCGNFRSSRTNPVIRGRGFLAACARPHRTSYLGRLMVLFPFSFSYFARVEPPALTDSVEDERIRG